MNNPVNYDVGMSRTINFNNFIPTISYGVVLSVEEPRQSEIFASGGENVLQ